MVNVAFLQHTGSTGTKVAYQFSGSIAIIPTLTGLCGAILWVQKNSFAHYANLPQMA
jgi:hypothetical protein